MRPQLCDTLIRKEQKQIFMIPLRVLVILVHQIYRQANCCDDHLVNLGHVM